MRASEETTANKSKSIFARLTAVAIFGILNTSFAVSYSSLIFSSTAPDYFVVSVALFLVGGCISSIIISSFSTYSGAIAFIQDVPVAISGLIALSLSTTLQEAGPDALFATTLMAIALSTLLTGLTFLLLGYFKLGNLVRFIPYPVMGGFLAATGWLLFKGGLQVSSGVGFQVLESVNFFRQADSGQLVCALAFGVGLLILVRRYSENGLVTPVVIIGSILLFLLVGRLLGYGMSDLENGGWMIGPLPEEPLWRSAVLPDLVFVKWSAVFSQAGSIATIIALSVVSMLLNSTGIEFIAGRDLDINRDLKANGIANLATGFLGVPSSYVFISQTDLAARMGTGARSVGILHGLFLLMVFFIGGTFLGFFPQFVAAGLPIYLGLSMLREWLVDLRRSIPGGDYAIILGILLTVEFFGFLPGIGVGLLAAVVIFVFRYSSIDIIKNEFDGRSCRSSRDRSIVDQRLLDYHSSQLMTLQLQGFIFFGTANSLYEKIKQLATTVEKPLRFVIIDMLLVQGIDSSAVKSFGKLLRELNKNGISLVIVNSSQPVRTTLVAGGLRMNDKNGLHYFADLEYAAEWCEDRIVEKVSREIEVAKREDRGEADDLFQAVYTDMMAALKIQVMFESLIERIQSYLEPLKHAEGDYLYRRNDTSGDLYFIVRGQVTLVGANPQGILFRFRTLGPWTLTGEIGAFLGYHAPYDARVEKANLIYRLTAENRKALEEKNPELAADLHQLIIIMLGSQLMKTTRAIGGMIG